MFFFNVLSMKPSPPITTNKLFFNLLFFNFLSKKILFFLRIFYLYQILFYSLVVPSARLELALPNGKDFKSFVSTNFTTRALMNFMSVYANIYN